jgi:uncharacterized protein (TIGR02421 family)
MLQRVHSLSEKFIHELLEKLKDNKMVRCTLSHNGRLYIERQLPFLCLYRMPPEYEDCGTEKLITGEASYLIASGMKKYHKDLSQLVLSIVKILSEQFGAFLIIEVWASLQDEENEESNFSLEEPALKIVTHKSRIPDSVIQVLERELKKIKVHKKTALVEIDRVPKIIPHGLSQIIPLRDVQKYNCCIIGLELKPIYRNWQTGEPYPLVVRSLHRMLTRALKQTFFEFVQSYTKHRPINYHALGKRACVKAVWEVDKKLAEISDTFDFLLQATPINTNKAWSEFKRKNSEHTPLFYYRPIPIEPSLLKQKLYNINIERVEDPTLAHIFREKRSELDRQITMLTDRNSRKFFYGSMQLYGGPDESLLHFAEEILSKSERRKKNVSSKKYIKTEELARYASEEISLYRASYPELTAQVMVRSDISGLIVSRGNLLIGRDIKIKNSRVKALLHHEVGTHILTYFNGQAQPFQLLHSGLAGYEELQEGIAVLSEYLSEGLNFSRLQLIAARVIAVDSLIKGASFIETFRLLNRTYGFEQHTAFTITMRVYRGGGLTKDAIYFRGLLKLIEYLKRGEKLEPLFIGKISFSHVSVISELRSRHILKKMPLMPRYLKLPHVSEKIERIRHNFSIHNLVEEKYT